MAKVSVHKSFNAKDLSPIAFGIILSPNPRGQNSKNSQINLETTNKNKNSNVFTIIISLESDTIASIASKDVLQEYHRILTEK